MIRMRDNEDDGSTSSGRGRGRGRGGTRARPSVSGRLDVPKDELGRLIQSLTDEMQDASRDLRFEEAARLRDEIHELKRELREVS
jgi:excinuclease ABC subunit B